jgi:hypothetical protein
MWCYICEVDIPLDSKSSGGAEIGPVIQHDVEVHCAKGQHCTAQAPECAVDTGPGMDHEKPYRCCACKEMVS